MALPPPRAPRKSARLKRMQATAAFMLTLLSSRVAADSGSAQQPAGGGRGGTQEVVVNLHVHVDAAADLHKVRDGGGQCPKNRTVQRARGGRVDQDGGRDRNPAAAATPLPQTAAVTPLPQTAAVTPLPQTAVVTPLPQAGGGLGECRDFPKAFSTPYRVLAVGDFHGDAEMVKLLLSSLGLIDQAGSWIAERTILVQTGDVLDRGPNGITLYKFLFRLRAEAKAKDSHMELLLGNHEVLNLAAMTMDPADFKVWQKEKNWEDAESNAEIIIRYITDWDEYGSIDNRMENRKAAWNASGELGSKLRDMDIIFRVGPDDESGIAHGITEGIIFVHANLDPDLVMKFSRKCGCTGQALVNYINGNFHKWLEEDVADIENTQVVEELVILRKVAQEAEDPQLQHALSLLGATRLVLGHTEQPDNLIHKRYNGTVYLIDTGMSRWMFPFGQESTEDVTNKDFTPAPSALELGASGGDAKALYPGRDLVRAQALHDALLRKYDLQNNAKYQRTFRCSDDDIPDGTGRG